VRALRQHSPPLANSWLLALVSRALGSEHVVIVLADKAWLWHENTRVRAVHIRYELAKYEAGGVNPPRRPAELQAAAATGMCTRSDSTQLLNQKEESWPPNGTQCK
jgi:hypothetical protein